MKRIISILMTLVLLAALTACGTAGDQSGSAVSSGEETEQAPSTEKLEPFCTTAVIEETLLTEENGVRITATELTYSAYSADLKLTIENNSGKNLSFTSGTLGYSCNSINGMMVESGYLNCDVSDGKKSVETVSFDFASLQLYGIREIAELELGICASDEDYNETYFAPARIVTSAGAEGAECRYRETITGAAAQNTFSYELLSFAEDQLYEEDGVAVLSQALIRNADGEEALMVEVENRAEELRVLSAGDISINGLQVERGIWSSTMVAPGKRAVIGIELENVLEKSCREACGMESIGSVGFDLRQFSLEGSQLTEDRTVSVPCAGESPLDLSGTELYSQNGIRITALAVLEPADEYDSRFHVLLAAENGGDGDVELEIPHQTLSVNGFMADDYGHTWELRAGQKTLMELELDEDDLEELGITGADQITQLEFELEVSQGRTVLDHPTILFDRSETT